MKTRLSIIIPYYNTEKYMNELLACLDRQMVPGVEVLIVDDGSKVPFKTGYSWAKVFRKENEGPGIARNVGLENMKGEYFTFMDSDDMVPDYYLEKILDKIETEAFDYCYLSWKTMPGSWNCVVKLTSVNDRFPGFNLCVWNRVYKTATFGDMRFDPKKLWSEDADFIYRLNERGKKSFIPDIMYFYRSDTPDSWTKKMFRGDLDYNRIVYNIREVKADNTALLKEIKKEYADNEIVLLTDRNEIPELEKYCMIMRYNTPVHGSILRGDKYGGFKLIEKPKRTQVLIWTARTQKIGGIETWIYQFCRVMRKYYDITVMYEFIDQHQLDRLYQIVECIKYNPKERILCDTCIINRITDKLPPNVRAKQVIQMVHTCKMQSFLSIPQDHDHIVTVSKAAAKSFNEEKAEVIYNLVDEPTDKKALILISATRLSKTSAFEKGHERMIELAHKLENAGIPYLWFLFTDAPFPERTSHMILLEPTLDIAPYMAAADYYISLSDAEGFGYSMVESLINGTPIITTPISVLPELEFEDGIHGYIVPFDMDFDVNILLNRPSYEYKRTNTESIKKWRKLLGNTKPTHAYKPTQMVELQVIKRYRDIQLDRVLDVGEVITVQKMRAESIQSAGFGRIVNEQVQRAIEEK